MAIHIAELLIRPASTGTEPLTNAQHTQLDQASRAFIADTWSKGWRGAGVMGRFDLGGRRMTVTCMALQHLDHDRNEGRFVVNYS